MRLPLQVTFRGMPPSEALEARVTSKAKKLERLVERVTACHVIIEAPHHHHHKGNIYSVSVEISAPGLEAVAHKGSSLNHAHEDPNVAIRDAFDAALRQIEERERRRRGTVKAHRQVPVGRVVRVFADDGYGFLETPDGLEVYFHENSVRGAGIAGLEVGDRVRFSMVDSESEKGPQATNVQAV